MPKSPPRKKPLRRVRSNERSRRSITLDYSGLQRDHCVPSQEHRLQLPARHAGFGSEMTSLGVQGPGSSEAQLHASPGLPSRALPPWPSVPVPAEPPVIPALPPDAPAPLAAPMPAVPELPALPSLSSTASSSAQPQTGMNKLTTIARPSSTVATPVLVSLLPPRRSRYSHPVAYNQRTTTRGCTSIAASYRRCTNVTPPAFRSTREGSRQGTGCNVTSRCHHKSTVASFLRGTPGSFRK